MKRILLCLILLVVLAGVVYAQGSAILPYITTFIRSLLDDADQGTARTTLGVGTGDSPTFTGVTVTGDAVLGLNSSVFRPAVDSTTFFQVKDQDANVIATIDTVANTLIANGAIINGTIATGLDMSGGTFATAVQNWPTTPVINVGTTRFIKSDATNYNIFLGTDAFNDGVLTNAVNEGAFNTGIGYRAGYHNDTTGAGTQGESNIYIGSESGYGISGVNNTGYGNTAIGRRSLYYNSSGYSNVALAVNTLFYNTTGYYNVAIGGSALYANTTGYYNTAIGGSALEANTTGTYNLGIGAGALGYNITGEQSVAIGNNASALSTNGSYNVAIGVNSLFNNKLGHYNTVIGHTAGYGVTNNSFNYNTLLGYRSGYSLSTGSSDIFIGHKSGYNQTTNGNLLIIDNQDRTSAALELTNSLIYGVFNATVASQSLRINAGTLTFNAGVDTDLTMNFTGTTNSGLLNWMEDEDYFKFSDDVVLADGETISTTQNGTTLGVGVTTFAVASNVMTITGDAGANTIATITGANSGTLLTLIFVDALVTITDTDAHTADTVDLAGTATNFVSADDTTLQLVYDGTSWYETSRSVN